MSSCANPGCYRHFSIINIWHTLRGVVEDTPLTLLDARSVEGQDLVRGKVRYARRNGEIHLVRNNPAHHLFYFPQMDRSHALVFKQYGSRTSDVATELCSFARAAMHLSRS